MSAIITLCARHLRGSYADAPPTTREADEMRDTAADAKREYALMRAKEADLRAAALAVLAAAEANGWTPGTMTAALAALRKELER